MKLYHGSNIKVKEINLEQCLPHKDFGRGFYTTTIYRHALERAQGKATENGGEAIVTEFNFDENVLTDGRLSVKCFKKPSDEWVDFVIMNRNKQAPQPSHPFDIVEGPVADDRMYAQFTLFEHGIISMATVLERITFRDETHQIAFCTPAAVTMLKREPDYAEVLIQYTIGDLAKYLMEDQGMLITDALNIVYNSNTYQLLLNEETGIYRESSAYVYEILKKELKDKNYE
jgi:hypothetical protein